MARIIFAPICSECGQILKYTIACESKDWEYDEYDRKLHWRNGVHIDPPCCPKCKAVFTHVVSAPDISRGVFFQTDELDNIIYDSIAYMQTPTAENKVDSNE